MSERWAGLTVSSDHIVLVDAEDDGTEVRFMLEQTWPLDEGPRAAAYRKMHQRIASHAREKRITHAILNASEYWPANPTKDGYEAAELRGVAMCALAETAMVDTILRKNLTTCGWTPGQLAKRKSF